MKETLASAILAIGLSTTAYAQSSTTLLITAPAPVEGPRDHCLYAGLAYSQDALLTVEIPNRRESPQALQTRLMQCVLADDGQTLRWQNFDAEQGGVLKN